MAAGRYRYVIVGAGAAGCVLADRLSADPACRVALLEAGGPDRKREIRIPLAASRLFQTAYDWNYRTSKQPQLSDNLQPQPRRTHPNRSQCRPDLDGLHALGEVAGTACRPRRVGVPGACSPRLNVTFGVNPASHADPRTTMRYDRAGTSLAGTPHMSSPPTRRSRAVTNRPPPGRPMADAVR
jgi:hypothetical protein